MTTTDSTEAFDVIVVGCGQAGLAVAYHLAAHPGVSAARVRPPRRRLDR